jgi:glycerol-3-phosphate dehydrogenase (NAD(P)+)
VPSRDEQGVALAGVLKNVYAIALGITDALHLGANARGILVQKALVEMLLIVRRLGGTTQTVYSLAGVGDLVATGTSLFSSNCILGRALVRDAKKASSLDSEGIRSFAMLWRRVSIYRSSLPLLAALAEVVVRGKSARQVWPKLFAVGE